MNGYREDGMHMALILAIFMLNSVELQTKLLDLIVSSNRFEELISTLSNWILPIFI
ncbi:hypothetical protein [Arsenophonus sp. ENCA]|uniref:hypothetical protein n=1 Tax=Arsenophonus sp. ENCA TaxID=1987579 RepID=UPI0025C4EAAE|nr:hypothetical protein [Arsenophonus sp. ENCA]